MHSRIFNEFLITGIFRILIDELNFLVFKVNLRTSNKTARGNVMSKKSDKKKSVTEKPALKETGKTVDASREQSVKVEKKHKK